eukprot:Rmarinus@m.8053
MRWTLWTSTFTQRETLTAWLLGFFVFLVVFGSFVGINLFVGVVFDHFARMRDKFNGAVFLTVEQRRWVDTQKTVVSAHPIARPPPPQHPFRRWCYNISNSRSFSVCVTWGVILNMGSLSLYHYDQSEKISDTLDLLNTIFLFFLGLEMAAKMLGNGVRVYFGSKWNILDFFVVVATFCSFVFGIVAHSVGDDQAVLAARLFRLLRVSAMFKLLSSASMRALLHTLMYSLPSLLNVGGLLVLFIFIYAVLGLHLFSDVPHGAFITSNANFETVAVGMLTLFRVATGEGWQGIMLECRENNAFGSPAIATAYFLSYLVIVTFVLLKLFIAIVLENFQMLEEENRVGNRTLRSYELEEFQRVWGEHDPQATSFIPHVRLIILLRRLEPPLGVGEMAMDNVLERWLWDLKIPIYNGDVNFRDVLYALTKRAFEVELPELASEDERVVITEDDEGGSSDGGEGTTAPKVTRRLSVIDKTVEGRSRAITDSRGSIMMRADKLSSLGVGMMCTTREYVAVRRIERFVTGVRERRLEAERLRKQQEAQAQEKGRRRMFSDGFFKGLRGPLGWGSGPSSPQQQQPSPDSKRKALNFKRFSRFGSVSTEVK